MISGINVLLRVTEIEEVIILAVFLIKLSNRAVLGHNEFVTYVDEEGGVLGSEHLAVDELT